ncbi:MAG: hypothetical protein WC756_19670 [Taibaiella sp.]|jgi:hypothetical protein
MELLKKEMGIIELKKKGVIYHRRPFVKTDYDYELAQDPLLNKPVFVLRALSEIIFSGEDYIIFNCFVIYILEYKEGRDTVSAEDLWKLTQDGILSMTDLLNDQLRPVTNSAGIKLTPLKQHEEQEVLSRLIVTAFRLN